MLFLCITTGSHWKEKQIVMTINITCKQNGLYILFSQNSLVLFVFFPIVSYDITSARDMLLLASCQEDQKKWVSHLIKKLPKTPPSSFVRASPRTLSTRSTANQSFRKVKNTSAKAR